MLEVRADVRSEGRGETRVVSGAGAYAYPAMLPALRGTPEVLIVLHASFSRSFVMCVKKVSESFGVFTNVPTPEMMGAG